MRKFFLILLTLFISAITYSQNVGIGTPTPSEKLDVNGNVNVQGNLKVNGNAGQPGQVLRVNNDGTQSWANTFDYKNRKEFTSPGITIWTVPTGVREIMIECVGGGGGGANGGGGGAGGYRIAVVKVVPGSAITVNVGDYGTGATSGGSSGGFGGTSLASGLDFSIFSFGGSGGTANNSGIGGNGVASGDSLMYVRTYAGGNGATTIEEYTQLDATTYITIRKFGNGGVCQYNPFIVSTGGFYSFNSTTMAVYRIISAPETGNSSPGHGGAGNLVFTFDKWGIDGGRGIIAISW